MISSTAFSVLRLDSTRWDLPMALFSLHATFLWCPGLRIREASSSISQIGGFDIHWERGGEFSGGGVGSSAFGSYNLLSSGLKSSITGGIGVSRGVPRVSYRGTVAGAVKVWPKVQNDLMSNSARPLFPPS